MALWDKFKKQNEAPEKASVAGKINKNAQKKTEAKSTAVKNKTEKTENKSTKKAKKVTSATRMATKTLIAPVVSEKTAQLSDRNVMVFRVNLKANRVAVRQAFKELYKVTPEKINIINVRGKRVKFGRIEGKRNDYKKALITLPKGVSVDVFEGV